MSFTKKQYQKLFKKYPDVVSAKYVAEMLDIGLKKAYRLLGSGEIRAFRVGNSLKTTKLEVINYVLQCAQQGDTDSKKK